MQWFYRSVSFAYQVVIFCQKSILSSRFATLFAAYASAALAVMRCLSVCHVSITFVHSVKTNLHIFHCFHRRVAKP